VLEISRRGVQCSYSAFTDVEEGIEYRRPYTVEYCFARLLRVYMCINDAMVCLMKPVLRQEIPRESILGPIAYKIFSIC
jgi:hypothetical protein